MSQRLTSPDNTSTQHCVAPLLCRSGIKVAEPGDKPSGSQFKQKSVRIYSSHKNNCGCIYLGDRLSIMFKLYTYTTLRWYILSYNIKQNCNKTRRNQEFNVTFNFCHISMGSVKCRHSDDHHKLKAPLYRWHVPPEESTHVVFFLLVYLMFQQYLFTRSGTRFHFCF